jgi:hypothetical protein
VRREQDGRAVPVAQPADVRPQVRAAVRIEPGRRLVEEHEPRLVHEAERAVEPPLLAARQRLDEPVAELREVERLAQRARAPPRPCGSSCRAAPT